MKKELIKITEKTFTKQVIDLANLYGWKVAHFRPGRVIRNGVEKYETAVAGDGKGWPDLFMVRKERLIAAELKVGDNKPTAEQIEWAIALKIAGIPCLVWRPKDWELIKNILE